MRGLRTASRASIASAAGRTPWSHSRARGEASARRAGAGGWRRPRPTVEHLPLCEEEAQVLVFEPATTLNTGNVESERASGRCSSWTGSEAHAVGRPGLSFGLKYVA